MGYICVGVEVPMKAGGLPAAGVTDAYEPLSLALGLRSEFGWPGKTRASHCWAVSPVAIGVPFPPPNCPVCLRRLDASLLLIWC